MAQQFLTSITLQNGLVLHGVFSPIQPTDLPDSPVVPGGYANPLNVIVDRAGRVIGITAGNPDSNYAYTDKSNTFTVLPQLFQSGGVTVVELDASGNLVTPRAGVTTNLVLGSGAGAALTTGANNNVLIGNSAGAALTTGFANVIIGPSTAPTATTATGNILLGPQAGFSLSTGLNNVFLGTNSGFGCTSGTSNTALGNGSMKFVSTGANNFALGDGSLFNVTTGGGNVALGQNALHGLNGQNNCIGIGSNAVGNGTPTGSVVAIGDHSLLAYSGNGAVTGIGAAVASNLLDGIYDTIIGWQAFSGAVHNNYCTVIGATGLNNATADNCTGIGYNTGATLTSGANNTLIGSSSDVAAGSTHDGIALGYQAVCGTNECALAPAITAVRLPTAAVYGWGAGAGTLDTAVARIVAKVVAPQDGTGGAGWLQNAAGRARVTADVTNATAALSNLSDLSLNLIAGRMYTGRLVIKGVNSQAAEGIQFDFNGGSATMTNFWAGGGILASGGTDVLGANISTSLAGVINWTTFTGESVVVIELSLVVNNGGTFIPRFAENTSVTGTATVRLGSYLWLEDSPN